MNKTAIIKLSVFINMITHSYYILEVQDLRFDLELKLL